MKKSLLLSTLLLLLSVNIYADTDSDMEDTTAVETTTESEVSGDQSQWYQNQNSTTETTESTEDSSESGSDY
ncbi:hypothetical protein [Bacteriovorax sp. Seq25_V]|uniref:hypothetical protein n=1 Tax=Bacteriovorax sp. Seq25_V TaxID=1201288 RepID=UPI000389DF27|nr:hypothetical protein [Bacteriovorax sp. Seq25_V]EQC44011.1 hypothetical protein M900_1160 [Bacteriovorax sp. Seq25_V]